MRSTKEIENDIKDIESKNHNYLEEHYEDGYAYNHPEDEILNLMKEYEQALSFEVKEAVKKEEDAFKKEWTKSVYMARRKEWNEAIYAISAKNKGYVPINELMALEWKMGFTNQDIKKAKAMYPEVA